MKIALAVNFVTNDRDANIAEITRMVREAAGSGARLVIFGETAVTGMINNDDPDHDLPTGDTIPGPTIELLSSLAKDHRTWLAIGLLERQDSRLYDSAVLLSPTGEIALQYRRIDPRWHGRKADPTVYCQGMELSKAETENGSFGFLICGDLWDDRLRQRVRDLKPDYLLHLFARSFDDASYDQSRWEKEEVPEYGRRVREIGIPTFAVSYLSAADVSEEAAAAGGAMVFSAKGVLQCQHPIRTSGMLCFEIVSH
jgi:predicted amidohydrolase